MSDGSRPLTRREARELEERAARGSAAFPIEPARPPQQSWSLDAAAPPAPGYGAIVPVPPSPAPLVAPAPAPRLAPVLPAARLPAPAPQYPLPAPAQFALPAPAPAPLSAPAPLFPPAVLSAPAPLSAPGPLFAPAPGPLVHPRGDIISLAAFPVDTRPTPAPKRAEHEHPSRRASRTGSARSRPPKAAAPRRPKRRLARTLFSGIALLFAGAIAIGTSLPVNAFMSQGELSAAAAAATAGSSVAPEAVPVQSLAVAGDAAMPTTLRDTFTVMSYQQQLRLRYGLSNSGPMFTPTTGAIRWPFPYSVPISDGWGYRDAPCSGCSSFHKGVDFTPGGGAPIYAIADGVVTLHDDTYYGLGNNVTIEHQINGQKVESIYAHMLTGSSPLVVGQVVKAGEFIGLVGDTGSSTGSHLHFEIHVSGEAVDPYAWLTANAVN